MSKHTKGPWIAVENGDGSHEILMGSAVKNPGGPFPQEESCVYEHGCYAEDGRHFKTAEANAHLIAAAPDLLDALKGLVDSSYYPNLVPSDTVWKQARAAIAKAEGGRAMTDAIRKLAEQITRSIPVQNAFYRHNLYTSVRLPAERKATEVEKVVAALEPILTAALSPLVEALKQLHAAADKHNRAGVEYGKALDSGADHMFTEVFGRQLDATGKELEAAIPMAAAALAAFPAPADDKVAT